MNWQYPQLLWLLSVPGLFMGFHFKRRPAALPFPAAARLTAIPQSPWVRLAGLGPWLQFFAVILAFIALARPQLVDTLTTTRAKGVDIAIALDLSSSMLAVDQSAADPKKNRLAVAKAVVKEFISRRKGDRIAVTAFGAGAYPTAPLTLNHDWLISAVDRLDTGSVEDGTALGDGLLAAINRLRYSPEKSRTVVLVTDGRSNSGRRTPAVAAAAAAALGIKVYTVGIGNTAGTLFPIEDPLGGVSWQKVSADLDEASLKEIARTTGGNYFRAQGADSLRPIFLEIDRLEKRQVEEQVRQRVTELFPYMLLVSLFLLMLEPLLGCGRLRSLP